MLHGPSLQTTLDTPLSDERPKRDTKADAAESTYRDWMRLFGTRFREARVGAQLTQIEVSAQLTGSTGEGQAYISKIERGQVNLTAKTMVQLAQIVGAELRKLACPPD